MSIPNPFSNRSDGFFFRRSAFVAPLITALLPASFPVRAQTVAAATDETVELSPFEVRAEADTGYQSVNTTSGSRLNTSLKDTAAAISPFTKEFLNDIAANSVDEMLQFATNYEPDYTDALAFNGATMSRGDASMNAFRIRGQPGSVAMDLAELGSPVDLSDVERAEVASGPNSILFGTANVGGLVALTTKRANLNRDANSVMLRWGSWANDRAEFDANRILKKGKLAVRFWGVWGDSKGWRYADFEDTRRINGSLAFKPWKTTTLSVTGGAGELDRHITYPWQPFDQFSLWRAKGSQLGGTATAADFPNRGIAALGAAADRFTFVENDNAVFQLGRGALLSRGAYTSASVNSVSSGFEKAQLSPADMPYNYTFTSPGARFHSDLGNYLIRLDQRIGENFVVEAGYQHTETKNRANTMIFGNNIAELSGDPNPTWLRADGAPTTAGIATANPHAGQLYFEDNWRRDLAYIDNDVARVTATYQLNLAKQFESHRFGRWLGSHQLVGLLERGWYMRARANSLEIAVNQANVPVTNPASPEGTNNQLWRRNYVTLGDYTTYHIGNPSLDVPSFTIGSNRYHSAFVGTSQGETAFAKRGTDTAMLATQSRWFADHLITTFGFRKDTVLNRRAIASRLAATDPLVTSGVNIANEWYLRPDAPLQETRLHTSTKTAGAVLHVPRTGNRLSLFYNQSNNTSAPRIGETVLGGPNGRVPDPAKGKGKDCGVMVDIMGDNRFFLRIGKYQSNQVGDPNVLPGGSTVTTHFYTYDIRYSLDHLRSVGRITQAEYDAHIVSFSAMTIDTVSEGTEVEFVANPTPNWTLRLTGSRTVRETSNMFSEGEPYTSEVIAFLKAHDDGQPFANQTAGALVTITDEINDLVTELNDLHTNREHQAYGSRPYKFNFTTRYRFSEGKMRGLFAGGAYIYQSPQIMTGATPQIVDYGKNIECTNLFAGKSLRFSWQRLSATVQLNVNNIFNQRVVAPGQYTTSTQGTANPVLRRVLLRTPREYRLTTTISF